MGYVSRTAIVVSSWNSSYLLSARVKAIELMGALVSPTVSGLNGAVSFFIAPEGSKSGWPEANSAADKRTALLRYFEQQVESGCYIDWVEVTFGTDDPGSDPARVTRSSDTSRMK